MRYFNIPSVSACGTGCSHHLLAPRVCEMLEEPWAHLAFCPQFLEGEWPVLDVCALLYCIRRNLLPEYINTSVCLLHTSCTHGTHLIAVTLICGFVSSPLQFWSRGFVISLCFSDYPVLCFGYNHREVIIM